jgi:ATP-dependent DNA helicase RecQ
MAFGLQDVITLRQFTQTGEGDEQFKRVSHHKLEAMLGLCELTSCRRQALLAYFGETLAEPCGNCDNCLTPPETWDAGVAAQKALSCVYRTGQRFGVNYLIDILKGKEDERIQRNGHDQISTFGIGEELDGVGWRGLYRQLIARGHLDIDHEGHGAIRLTEKCRPLLRGEAGLQLRRQRKAEKEKKKTGARLSELRSCDQPLFEAMRVLRLELAQEQGVPPYVIFHDSTLQEMARSRPESEEKMRYISGVGERKLAQYGSRFLALIQAHPLSELLDNRLSDTVNETLLLHTQGVNAKEIAARRELKLATIYGHLAEAIEAGLADVREVLPLNDAQYREITSAMELLNICEQGSLKPLHEALEEAYDYGTLRCVPAAECLGRGP